MESEIKTCKKHERTIVIWLYPDEELCCPLCRVLKTIEQQKERLEKLENDLVPF